MRLTNRQTIWRPGTSQLPPSLCPSLLPALLAPLIAFLLLPSFSLRVSPSSPIAHCHPSMCAILLLAPPKNICLPFYRCWFAWQLWQRQIALLAKLRSGYARPERESEREKPSGSGKWERERAKRARYNDAWLPRQQRQRQRSGDCDCGCRCLCSSPAAAVATESRSESRRVGERAHST